MVRLSMCLFSTSRLPPHVVSHVTLQWWSGGAVPPTIVGRGIKVRRQRSPSSKVVYHSYHLIISSSNSEFPSPTLQQSQHFNLSSQRIELPVFSQPQPETRCLKSTYEPTHPCRRSYPAILTSPGLPQGRCQQGQAGRVIPTLPSHVDVNPSLTNPRAKKHCTDQGGKIEHEFKLVPGFTYIPPSTELPSL
jgi:hypothetical protein